MGKFILDGTSVLKLNKPLLVHKIIRDTCGGDQIENRMRPHRRDGQHVQMRYDDNGNADVVEEQMEVHVSTLTL